MNQLSSCPVWAVACVAAGLSWSAAAQQGSSQCEQAWDAYNRLKSASVMEPSQYPLTVEGAAVRSACGKDALPVPPGSDTPLLPIIRKPKKPANPIVPPRPSVAPTPPGMPRMN
jgi:hypothetical protein